MGKLPKNIESQLPSADEGAFLGGIRPINESDLGQFSEDDSMPSIGDLAEIYHDVDPSDPISYPEIARCRSRIEELNRFCEDFPEETESVSFSLQHLKDELALLQLYSFNKFPTDWLDEIEPIFVRARLSALQRRIVYLTLVGKNQKQIGHYLKKNAPVISRNKKSAHKKLCISPPPLGVERIVWFTMVKVINSKGRYGPVPMKTFGETVSKPRRHEPT